MVDSAKPSRPAKAVLNEARSLLSFVNNKRQTSSGVSSPEKQLRQEGSGGTAQNAKAGGDLFLHCASLVEDFHRLALAEFKFEFKDWTVVKAVVELLVRWGIYPYLSPGVGIPLQQRFGEKAAAAAAAAVSDHLRHDATDFEASGPAKLDSNAESFETHPLILSAELLSSLALKSPPVQHSEASSGITDDSAYSDSKLQKEEEKLPGSKVSEEEKDPGFSSPAMALHQLVLSHHLVDVLAAHLQSACGPLLPSTSRRAPEVWKKNAAESIKVMAERLPVAHLVEALFILLGEGEGPKPPFWLKPEVGKLLSVMVMRDGGVAAVMERLVGSAERGSMHVYERVAAQLARVPRSVASKDQYYRGVCMQLQLLLVLPSSHSKFGSSSDIASQLIRNMHHTSILLACTLAHQDPVLVERYLTRPIVEPLLCWGALQPQSQIASTGSTAQDKAWVRVPTKRATAITERMLVESILKVQVLLTAGHKGSLCLRRQLLQLTSPLAPLLMFLNYQLWPFYTNHDGQGLEGMVSRLSIGQAETQTGENHGRQKEGGPQKDFARGFLISKSLSTPTRAEGEQMGPVGQFVGAISDIVHAHLSGNMTEALSTVCAFLFDLEAPSLEWPRVDGEIADALKGGREQPDSPAVFLSKLVLQSESWELALALLGVMLNNVLKLRQTTQRNSRMPGHDQSNADILTPKAVLQTLQTVDIIYGEVGLKAVEQDASGALPLLKALLDDNGLLEDMEMLELVLPLVHSAVSQLQRGNLHEDEEKKTQVLNKNQRDAVLNSIGISLEKVQESAGVTAELKQFAAKLRSMIYDLLKD